MLGYVKVDSSELKGKHQALYRAVYCGLCHTATRRITPLLAPFHSYDFAFLATVRLAFEPEKIQIAKKRCFLHPFRKRAVVLSNPELEYCAAAELVLITEKLQDEVLDRDVSFFRRLAAGLCLPLFRKKIKKLSRNDPALSALSESVASLLSEGRRLEKENADLDSMCENFSKVLSLVFTCKTEGEKKTILARIGDMLGRFLYTIDAVADREKDRKKGSFNPLLHDDPSEEDLQDVMHFYLQEIMLAQDLIHGDRDLVAICENIAEFGLVKQLDAVLKTKTEKQNERPF